VIGLIDDGKLRTLRRISGGYAGHVPCSRLVMMRGCVVLVVFVAGCIRSSSEAPGLEGVGVQAECNRDDGCVAVGVKCCDCPSFAVPASDESHQACEDVMCSNKHCPRNVRAACDLGRCVLVCLAMECRQSCLFGFATDASGCLSCACAGPVVPECLDADDCVEVRADCCGCARGGRDTAVLRDDAEAFDAGLRCPAAPQCPPVNTCEPTKAPQCIRGRCALGASAALPADACGRFDVGVCASDEVCVVNGPNARVNEEGLGLCMPASSQAQDR